MRSGRLPVELDAGHLRPETSGLSDTCPSATTTATTQVQQEEGDRVHYEPFGNQPASS